MAKFAVGDRVRVYDVCQVTHKMTEDTGTVSLMQNDGGLVVRMDTWGTSPSNVFTFHPKQCRKLKPKKKPMRVECKVSWKMNEPDLALHAIVFPCKEGFKSKLIYQDSCWQNLIGKRGTLTFVEDL